MATLSPALEGPHLSFGYTHGDRKTVYGELAGNVGLTLGAGLGYRGSADGSGIAAHLFAGLPVPLFGVDRDGPSNPYRFPCPIAPLFLYLEPFYRPVFLRGAATEHQLGVMLKLRVGLTRRQWKPPGFAALGDVFI